MNEANERISEEKVAAEMLEEWKFLISKEAVGRTRMSGGGSGAAVVVGIFASVSVTFLLYSLKNFADIMCNTKHTCITHTHTHTTALVTGSFTFAHIQLYKVIERRSIRIETSIRKYTSTFAISV